jgi:hypothetical protein
MVTLTGSLASAGAPSDLSSLQTSSSKSAGSLAEQFASVIEQFLGQSQTGSRIEIDVNAAPGQPPGARQFTVTVNGAPDAQTPAAPAPNNTPQASAPTAPASAPAAQLAPVSGVAWMLGDPAFSASSLAGKSQDPFSGAIVDSSRLPGVPALGTVTEVQWYQLLQRAGLIGDAPPPPTIPGYIAPENANFITVAARPGDPGGTYIGLEGKIQRDVQGLVGAIATQGLTDAQVTHILTQDMNTQNAYLNGQDPNSGNIAALVAKYVGVYRNAVTLPAPWQPTYTLPGGPVVQPNPAGT